MTYVLYGYSAADVAATSSGPVAPGQVAWVYTAPVGGARLLDLKAVDLTSWGEGSGLVNGNVTSDSQGRVGFFANEQRTTLFLDWRDGKPRWPINPAYTVSLLGDAAASVAASAATATQAKLDAQAAATGAAAALYDSVANPGAVAVSANKTLALTDQNKVVQVTGSGIEVTVPVPADVAFPTGAQMDVTAAAAFVKIKPRYLNGITNPDPTTSSTGYSPRSNSSQSLPGNGITATATASGSCGLIGELVLLSTLGLKPGDRLSVRAYVSALNNMSTAGLAIRFQAGTATVGSEVRPGDTAGVGDRVVTHALIPATADGFRIIYYSTASAAGGTITWRQSMGSPSLGAGVALTYADGNTPGCAWLGTAGASASQGPLIYGELQVPAGGRLKLRHQGLGVWQSSLVGGLPSRVITDDSILVIDPMALQAGLTAPSPGHWTAASLTLVPNRMYGSRFVVSKATTTVTVSFNVTQASSTDDACEVTIFDASGNRVLNTGALTGRLNSVGIKNITVSLIGLALGGVYYASLGSASSTAIISAAGVINLYGTALPQVWGWYKDQPTSGSYLSASTVSGVTATSVVPLIAVRST